jgi:hypothetical protein
MSRQPNNNRAARLSGAAPLTRMWRERMKTLQLLTLSALLGGVTLGLTGCDMAEQAGRELAAKAEESAKQMAQETLKESVDTLNEKVDEAQKSAETWIGKPPPASNEKVPEENSAAEPSAAPGSSTTET